MFAQVFSFRWLAWSVTCLALLTLAAGRSLDTDNLRPQRKPAPWLYDDRDVGVNSPWTPEQREQAAQAWRDRQLHGPARPLDIQADHDARREQGPAGGDYHLPLQPPRYEPVNQDIIGNIERILDNAQANHRAYEARQRAEQLSPRTVSPIGSPQPNFSGVDAYLKNLCREEAYRQHLHLPRW
jgi:hypothetical protein